MAVVEERMCQACPDALGPYQSAYARSRSATVTVKTWCPKCRGGVRVERRAEVHEGGEIWEPWLACGDCGWGMLLSIGVVMNERKTPLVDER